MSQVLNKIKELIKSSSIEKYNEVVLKILIDTVEYTASYW